MLGRLHIMPPTSGMSDGAQGGTTPEVGCAQGDDVAAAAGMTPAPSRPTTAKQEEGKGKEGHLLSLSLPKLPGHNLKATVCPALSGTGGLSSIVTSEIRGARMSSASAALDLFVNRLSGFSTPFSIE